MIDCLTDKQSVRQSFKVLKKYKRNNFRTDLPELLPLRSSSSCLHVFCDFLPVAQRSNSESGRVVIETSRSHTVRHKQPVGILCTIDRLVAEAATYATKN